ncbi:FliC/FljB family flagellin [Cobetia sp. 4B]|uniref:FliC/FljB family flagellin n=1 Tax=Cobetia sp. 4B TaxID=2758724 RepID=UPI001C047A8C|nr:FliC/FljB family flagellin [Cobetia sp. 4B]MBR9754525.1 FliC/FljB family flagellin [Gammaproteobacteria bacterium]QWN35526.1 FliC/FljB family flagellin [Cobetia sp. 4B]
MASVINTNTLSMVTQQNLNQSQNALNTSMERLSSGMRINSAKDDAAGQAIANRMDSQITGLSQAQRNANDGISVAQTAEGALNQVNDNLQRVRELTVQAQNGTNNADDLQSIQDEITLRMEEIDRISEQTSFNGVDVLNTNDSLNIQVGANDGETISISLSEVNSSTLGLGAFSVAEGFDTDTLSATTATETSFSVKADTSNLDSKETLVSYDDSGTTRYAIETDDGAGSITYTDAVIDPVTGEVSNSTASTTGLTGGASKDGNATTVNNGSAVESLVTIDSSSYSSSYDDLKETTDGEFILVKGSGSNVEYYEASVGTDGVVTAGSELSTTEKTTDPLAALDSALKQVDSMRSDLGAVQNRFDSAITNLATTETNLASAQSRIQDADYAEEVSSMTTAQILQQAGTSMLTQANQVPQNVLSLLG